MTLFLKILNTHILVPNNILTNSRWNKIKHNTQIAAFKKKQQAYNYKYVSMYSYYFPLFLRFIPIYLKDLEQTTSFFQKKFKQNTKKSKTAFYSKLTTE